MYGYGVSEDFIDYIQNDAQAFYKVSLKRIAAEFGITTPLQLMARAENDSETYADILIKIIREKLNENTSSKS